MPDLVGRRLSAAEAALTTAGFMSVSAVDAGGRDREILDDDNWVVTRQQPVAGAAVTPGLSITLGAVKPTDTQGSPDVRKGVVPDVLCHDLQDAQDALRSAGFYVLIAKDGLGRHRYPVLDRDWVVVGQSAAAGSRPKPTGKIELTVVKYGEPTGSSGCRS
jgi:beta-lactam-binding protein with PASTA domain